MTNDMLKTRLTAEESAKLIELGVSPERASNMWVKSSSRSYTCERNHLLLDALIWRKDNDSNSVNYGFIFTLADILDILPKEIRHNGCTYKLNIDYPPIGMVAARYNTEDDDLDSLKGYLCEELIDALYSLLVWCLEKGHVKLN